MYKYYFILVFLFIQGFSQVPNNEKLRENNVKISQKREVEIKKILSKLTLQEKIGQMTQINIDVLGKGKDIYKSDLPFTFNEERLEEVIKKYKVGSILNAPATTALTVEEWENIIAKLQKKTLANGGIPLIYGVDEIHGATYTAYSTLMPQSINMGATFNRELVKKSAEVTAYETKASNIPWNFSPVLDLGLDPRWPRQWETYGEDSYLVSEMGKQMVMGYQGNGDVIDENHVASCLKHFLGYSVPVSGKDRTPAIIPEDVLREKFYKPFEESIKAGALSVMLNSSTLNGIPVHANKKLINGWLKEELNWDGVVITDWADIDNIWSRDKVTKDRKEAIKLSINAGVDMAMVPYDCNFIDILVELVKENQVPISRIDDAVSRILRLKMKLNLFEKPNWKREKYPDFASKKHTTVSYDAAAESIVLLKNNQNILPLKKGAKILVAGPNANSMRTLNGGWSYSWQGEKVDQFLPNGITFYKALQSRFGNSNVTYEPGVTYKMDGAYWEENNPNIVAAVNAAKNADYIVLCLGENSYSETSGNLNDLYLSDNQQNLARELSKTGKPIIYVLNEGRPRIISKIENYSSAVLQTFLPGSEGGEALADILIGKINPSGKLNYTYPKYPNSLTVYSHKPSESTEKMEGVYDYSAEVSVQWAFGHGLSYTNFEYSNLKISKPSFNPEDTITITLDVKNTGNVEGKESVLLFVNDLVASVTPDVRRLRRFEKINLKTGETKSVTFELPVKELSFVNPDGKYILEEGDFNIQVGNLSQKIYCQKTKLFN